MGILSAIGLRGVLIAVSVAAVAFLAWDYQSTKADLAQARLDLAAAEEARRFDRVARQQAIEEADRQRVRADLAELARQVIRRQPDAQDAVPAVILDAIDGVFDAPGDPQTRVD